MTTESAQEQVDVARCVECGEPVEHPNDDLCHADSMGGPDLRLHVTEAHGLPESERQDMDDMQVRHYHHEAHRGT